MIWWRAYPETVEFISGPDSPLGITSNSDVQRLTDGMAL